MTGRKRQPGQPKRAQRTSSIRSSSQRATSNARLTPNPRASKKKSSSSKHSYGSTTSRALGPKQRGNAKAKNLNGTQVEGRQAVHELLMADTRKVSDIWIADDIERATIVGDIVELAAEKRVPLRSVSRTVLEAEARSDASQGVLAHAAAIEPVDFDLLCQQRSLGGDPPFLLALDGVTDPRNLGALLRSGVCAGITGVVLPRHRAAHITPTVTKASAGAVEHVSMSLVSGLPAALLRAKELGVWTVGLDAEGETSLFDLKVGNEAVMVVLGSEGSGISRLTRARCDVVVSIPLLGPLSSLNVGAAGALACYEVARGRGQLAKGT